MMPLPSAPRAPSFPLPPPLSKDRVRGPPRTAHASATGTRARVARVRAEYPNQLDYSGYGRSSLMSAGLDSLCSHINLSSGSMLGRGLLLGKEGLARI